MKLINEISDACNALNNISSLNQIELSNLRSEVEYHRFALAESAKCTMKTIAVVLGAIWPLTKNPDIQISLFENMSFLDVIFDNFRASDSIELLIPIIGILANINSNKIVRTKIGLQSGLLMLEKPNIFSNIEYQQVLLFLLYNISFETNISMEMLNNGIVQFLYNNVNVIKQNKQPKKFLLLIMQKLIDCIKEKLNNNENHMIKNHIQNIYKMIEKSDISNWEEARSIKKQIYSLLVREQ